MDEHTTLPSFNSRGFTLVEVLVSVAVLAILAISIALIFSNANRLAAKPEAILNVESVGQTVNLILRNAKLCDNALRPNGQMGAGTHVPFIAGGDTPIDHIQFYDPTNPATDAIAVQSNANGNTPTSVGPILQVDQIVFKETVPGQGRSTMIINGTVYNTYTGYVQVSFITRGDATGTINGKNLAGGPPPPQKIPLGIAVGPGVTIDYCYVDAAFGDVCTQAGGTLNSSGNCTLTLLQKFKTFTCPPSGTPTACGAGFGVTHTGIWAVTSFAPNGDPVCTCVDVNKGP